MTLPQKAQFITKTLNKLFPETPIPLQHTNAYTLLVAVVLSAQCTDERVNKITPQLFALANTPQTMQALPTEVIANIIR
nr:hypothetical protein [Chitinophagales bacterium]